MALSLSTDPPNLPSNASLMLSGREGGEGALAETDRHHD